MSGSAGLSSAKNRRSGNEVKFNGQTKSLPPGERTSIAQHQQQQQQQQKQQQQQALGRPPNPIDILKSHELRIQQLETDKVKYDLLNHSVDYLTLKTEMLTLKNALLEANKSDELNIRVDKVNLEISLLKNLVSDFTKMYDEFIKKHECLNANRSIGYSAVSGVSAVSTVYPVPSNASDVGRKSIISENEDALDTTVEENIQIIVK